MSPKMPAKVFRRLRMVSSLSSGPFSGFSPPSLVWDSLRNSELPVVGRAWGGPTAATSAAEVWEARRGAGRPGAGPGGGGPGGGPLGGPRAASWRWGTGGGAPGG